MDHPRIALLRSQVHSLPLDEHCRAVLLKSIEYFAEQIVAHPRCTQRTGRDNLVALHHAAPSGMMQRALQEKYSG